MFELFVIFSFWWWAIIAVGGFFLVLSINDDSWIGATVVSAITLAVLTVLGTSAWVWIQWCWHNPWLLCAGLLGYVLLALIWSIVKWYFFLTDCRAEYVEQRDDWLETKDEDPGKVPEHLMKAWLEHAKSRFFFSWRRHAKDFSGMTLTSPKALFPKAKENKGRIVTWMVWWPLSIIWTIIADWVKRFFSRLFEFVKTLFDRISARIFKEV
jgi:hypothetical protein